MSPARKRAPSTGVAPTRSIVAGTAPGTGAATRANPAASRTRDALVLTLQNELEAVSTAALDEDDAPLDDEFPETWRDDDDEPAAGDEEWADAVPGPLPPRAQIVLSLSSGLPHVWIPGPPAAALLDRQLAHAAVARQDRLREYAAEICRVAAATLAAPTLSQAYDALHTITAAQFAAALKVDEARLSEDRDVVVRIPAGLVHLGFFTSKTTADGLVEYLWRQPDLLEADVETLRRRAAERGGGSASTVGKYVGWLRTARRAPGVVRSAAAEFARDPRHADAHADALRDALHDVGTALGIRGLEPSRGKPVAQRGLYGGLL